MVEVALELAHGEVEFAADLAAGFARGALALPLLQGQSFQKLAHLAEVLAFAQVFHPVARLVEACIALIAVHHSVFVVALCAEADFAVRFE